MSTVRELHTEAMSLANQALIARHQKDWKRAEALARAALDYEKQAAELVPDVPDGEPTRSILYRSAASLAYQAKDFSTAQRLIAKGLSGYPTPDVEEELKKLYEQVNYELHLQTRGIILEEDDLQVSMHGDAVGSGNIVYSEFKRRIDQITNLIDRTTQRLMDATYKGKGRIPQTARPFLPTLSAPREGSFAITIKLALVQGQMQFIVRAEQVIDELINGLELLNENRQEDLRAQIQNDLYYRNFVFLARDIAPDGKRINFVGFTSSRNRVGLTVPRHDIAPLPPSEEETELDPIEVSGILDYATTRRERRLGLTTDDDKSYFVKGEKGMEDLVRAYFQQDVIVRGFYDKDKNLIHANDILPANE
jgi:hypothetical protein